MENAVKSQVTLKSLQTRLQKERAEIGVLTKQRNDINLSIKERNKRMDSINYQISQLTKDTLSISEHAKLRFLERVELIPVEEVESRVITEELKKMWGILGDGIFPINIGEHTCSIKGGVITTIK